MTERHLLCDAAQSLLIVIDIQTRLVAAMPEEDGRRVLRNSAILLQAAKLLNIPVLVSEQYPKGLGKTDPDVARHLPDTAHDLEKTCFSVCGAQGFQAAIEPYGRRQIILIGMETHVCVLQSALELRATDTEVFTVTDSTCSRTQDNHTNALARMNQAGVIIATTESVLFEWLRDASHEHFKKFSALIR